MLHKRDWLRVWAIIQNTDFMNDDATARVICTHMNKVCLMKYRLFIGKNACYKEPNSIFSLS